MNATAWIDELKSPQNMRRLLAQRGAELVAMLLLAALAIDAAIIVTEQLGRNSPASLSAPVAAAPPSPAPNPTLELATIVNAHLFGSAGALNNSDAPQTSMPLVLAGVIAVADPGKGQAIIGQNATAAKLYAVGSMIPGGVRLHSVYGDRVLLDRNGTLEALLLPRTPIASAGAAAPNAADNSPGQRPQNMRDNATLFNGLIRVQPVFNQGKLSGYRIFPGARNGAAIFEQLGLRAGDLITAVNGTALDDQSRAMEVLGTLSSASSATVTVSRNSQQQEVNLNLANLNTAEGAPDTAGAQDAPGGLRGGRLQPGAPGGPAGAVNAGTDSTAAPAAGGGNERAAAER